MEKIKKNCIICNKVFYTKRKTTVACSPLCRYHATKKKREKLNCKKCGKEFLPQGKAVCCSDACNVQYKKDQQEYFNVKARKDRLIKELGEDGYKNLPKCLLCSDDYHAKDLKNHVMSSHNMTIAEYREKFNLTTNDTLSEETRKGYSDRIAGDKNPGYQHGGILSPYSYKSYMKDGYSEEEARKLAKEKSRELHDNMGNESRTCCLEYYTSRGYSERDAQKQLSNRQTTFDKKICIEKYGQEEGLKRWEERQNKWLQTLDAKSPEEKTRINMLKGLGGCKATYSMEACNFFSNLEAELNEYEEFKDLNLIYAQEENEFFEFSIPDVDYQCVYFYDFTIPKLNIIIEYNGSLWHPRPEEFDTWKHPYKLKEENYDHKSQAEKMYKKNMRKLEKARNGGFSIFEIWDYDDDKIKKCINFIKEAIQCCTTK